MAIEKSLLKKNYKYLQDEQRRLEGLLNRVAKPDKAGGDFHARYPDFGTQEDENAAEVATYEANVAEGWDLEQKLNRVRAALDRIKNGTYGICQTGGEELPAERLAAVPEAENCIRHDHQKR